MLQQYSTHVSARDKSWEPVLSVHNATNLEIELRSAGSAAITFSF